MGSRLRNRTQRFLQKGRQLERRNPALAALRIAPVRNFENGNESNVLLAQRHGLVNAQNFVQEPLDGHWGAVGQPLAAAMPLPSDAVTHIPGPTLSESHLYSAWTPVAVAARRPMTNAETRKE